ncbi:MAG TPA: ankyrin repeat domain-containing protein [bacterium]|jgi:uncharacterized damage-inducible protein DinB|nr:ankyrin repeat domain-containing protein [bacterium]
MTGKELLLHHLDHTFEKESSQLPLAMAVRGLTAAQAAWKPSPDRHSIWQIVRHLTHWKEGVIAALDGKPLAYEERNRTDWQEVAGAHRDWEADVERLKAISHEIRARVEEMDDATLSREIKWYQESRRSRPILTRLLDIATHDIYHTGQIQYLFAIQEIPVEEFAAAAALNDVGRLERILQKDGTVLSAFTRDGWTALHFACAFGRTEAVQFLLALGATVNAVSRNDDATTPLHLAVGGVGTRREKATLLIQHGADLAAHDAGGKTPLDLAREEGDADLVTLLQAKR